MLDWLYLLLILIPLVCGEFHNHGLIFGKNNFSPSRLIKVNKWEDIANSTVSFDLFSTKEVLVRYKVMVEGLKVHTPRSPLPSESKKDILQIRAVVDGVPFLHSSSYVSTYLVEQRTTHSLAGEFIANLTSINNNTFHSISLQWKKLGKEVEEWRLIQPTASNIGSEQYISVLADHDQVWYIHDRKDYLLTASDEWKNIGR